MLDASPAAADTSITPVIGLKCNFIGRYISSTSEYSIGPRPDGLFIVRRRFFASSPGQQPVLGKWENVKSYKVDGDWVYFWESTDEKYAGMMKVTTKSGARINVKSGTLVSISETNGSLHELGSRQCNFDPQLMQPFDYVGE